MPARLFPSSVLRRGCLAALAIFALLPSAAHAARHTAFERAEQLRDALEGKPEGARNRGDYERVLEAYRSVYHANPGDSKASTAVNMVAGLLAEEGRVLGDEKPSHDAIGQFEFLRAQYPASPYGESALLAEGSIYLHDLHDPASARAAYQHFLKSYPHHPLAAQARAGLRETRHQSAAQVAQAAPATRTSPQSPTHEVSSARNTPVQTKPLHSAVAQPATPTTASAPTRTVAPRENELTKVEQAPALSTPVADSAVAISVRQTPDAAAGQPLLTGAMRTAAQQHRGRLPVVTNVRHWSTPVYTRVAIDLQDQVQYEAARVPNPDRIYFDLHGARVAPELIGKTVTVTDDGFLQRIRVAQFSNDVTRIVLDVSQVSDYSAFFLPNPWRLIIDIHGRRPGSAAPQYAIASQAERPAQPVATSADASNASTPQATRELRDIASLGAHPDQVKATSRPTTGPISANVARVPGSSRKSETKPDSESEDEGAKLDLPGAAPDATNTPHSRSRHKPARPDSQTTTDRAVKPADPDSTKAPDPPTRVVVDDGDADASDATPATAHVETPRIPPSQAPLPSPTPSRSAAREARSTLDGQRSLTRALGLKIGRIVVDAGHGGHDSGTLGPGGIEEKDIVLDVALRLGKLLHDRLGADVTYTRDDDTFIPLEQRTAIANKAQADLFISVHANSSSDPTARGVETYYLNFTTSPDALEVAARENAVSDQSVHELAGLVKKITLKDKIDESREFAVDVQHSLYSGLERDNPGLRDRGVKKAPFVVLIGANMPSILAEISFLTNPSDATELRRGEYRERIAESLYRGVAHYCSGLSGLRIAANTRAPGQ